MEEKSSRAKAKEWPIKRHERYKEDLRISSSKWFQSKNRDVHPNMDYCLPEFSDWPKNIILESVATYIQDEKDKAKKAKDAFPLHRYLHHGLSSQALAFNLIGPLIIYNDYKPLENALGFSIFNNEPISKVTFEYDNRNTFNEDTGQPTSFDIAVFGEGKDPTVLIESKLTESEFGLCSVMRKGDCSGQNPIGDYDRCFLHFIGRKYWTLMQKYGIDKVFKDDTTCIFANYYQFFRELLFCLEHRSKFVLLLDERSPVFYHQENGIKSGILPFLIDKLPKNIQKEISVLSIQKLVKEIDKSNRHNDWIVDFKRKYAI